MFEEVASGILPNSLLDLLSILLLAQKIVFQVRVGRCWERVIKVIGEVDGTFAGTVVDASMERGVRGLCWAARSLNQCERQR